MIYSYIVSNDARVNPRRLPVRPGLLYIQKVQQEGYDPVLKIDKKKISDIQQYATDLNESLSGLVSEIFEPTRPFIPTADRKHCLVCPYRQLCGL